jgi:hypothetical protein
VVSSLTSSEDRAKGEGEAARPRTSTRQPSTTCHVCVHKQTYPLPRTALLFFAAFGLYFAQELLYANSPHRPRRRVWRLVVCHLVCRADGAARGQRARWWGIAGWGAGGAARGRRALEEQRGVGYGCVHGAGLCLKGRPHSPAVVCDVRRAGVSGDGTGAHRSTFSTFRRCWRGLLSHDLRPGHRCAPAVACYIPVVSRSDVQTKWLGQIYYIFSHQLLDL